MSHPELQQEQAYVDHAYDCLDRMRDTLHRTQDSMATEFAALAIEAWAKRRAKTFQDAEQGLCFGRLTLGSGPRPLYIGRRWVHDDEGDMLVVNWQAPAARLFYTPTPQDAPGATPRGRYPPQGRARRHDAAALPHRPAPNRRHPRRVARRQRRRGRFRLGLPARGARAE